MTIEIPTLEPIQRLTRDLKQAAAVLSEKEARFLVDAYYSMQDFRIQGEGQVRAMSATGEPHALNVWLASQMRALENEVKKALGVFAESKVPGQWALSQYGIGPVITAGLLAHFDITKAPTVGHFWSFAGLDPNKKWEKGQKRPWNAKLKVLCWKAGESFKKFSNHPECYYGHIYRERKQLEIERNNAGLFAEQAKFSLATKKIQDADLKAKYEAGKLPDGRLDLRAARYATKLFLAHLHEVMFFDKYGKMPPKPYVIEHVAGHVHWIGVPNGELVPGLREAEIAVGARPPVIDSTTRLDGTVAPE